MPETRKLVILTTDGCINELGYNRHVAVEMKIVDRTMKLRLGFAWHLRRSLSWIPEGDLFGLDEIVLEERLGPATATSPDWHHQIEGRNLTIGGVYCGRHGDLPASIVLYLASLYRGIPRIYWLSPVITLRLTRLLAHEVGHHLIRQRGYIFERGERIVPRQYEEELAYRYSFSVCKRMFRRWYYRFADWLTRDLAGWHYAIGITDWRLAQYKEAAARWEIAFCLDRNRDDADYWYHKAQKMLATKTHDNTTDLLKNDS